MNGTNAAMVLGALLSLGAGAAPRAKECREATPGLSARAKVSCATARATALERVPRGTIESAELEEEHHQLVYSFDIRAPKRSGVQEVLVDAVSGRIVSVQHETPANEAAEKKESPAPAKGAHH